MLLRLQTWIVLAAAAGMAWLSIGLFRPPAVVPASAPDDQFSGERAFRHLEVIARRPHIAGSAANADVRDYLVREFRALGAEPVVQPFTIPYIPFVGEGQSTTLRNILVRLPGTANTRAVMLAAHYDTKPHAPGAGDDGAGVAALLETVRALKSTPLRNDLIVLVTDGEEAGMLGAQAFVKDHPWVKDIGIVLNFDNAGSSGPVLMYQASSGNRLLVETLAESVPSVASNSVFEFASHYTPGDTDFSPFRSVGLTGMNFAFIGGRKTYHQPIDTPENLNQRTLQHVGMNMLGLARHFGNAMLPLPASGDAIFFNPLGLLFVHYSIGWVLPSSIGLALLAIGLAMLGRRRGLLRGRDFLYAGLGIFAASVLAGAIGWLLAPAMTFTESGYIFRIQKLGLSIAPDHAFQIPITGAAIAAALAAIAYHIVHSRLSIKALLLTRALAWSLLGVILGFALPPLSYLAFWPALLDCAQLTILTLTPSARGSGRESLILRWLVSLLPALVAVALFAPLLYLLWLMIPAALPLTLVLAAGLTWSALAATGN